MYICSWKACSKRLLSLNKIYYIINITLTRIPSTIPYFFHKLVELRHSITSLVWSWLQEVGIELSKFFQLARHLQVQEEKFAI